MVGKDIELVRTKFEADENKRLLEKFKNDFAENIKEFGEEIKTELETPVKINRFRNLMLKIKYILGL